MSFPASAFVKAIADEVPVGSLILLETGWALRTFSQSTRGPVQQILMLSPGRAGSIYAAPKANCFATSPKYGIEIRIKDPLNVKEDAAPTSPLSLVAGQFASELWGHIAGAPLHRYGFKIDGSPSDVEEEHNNRPFFHFTSFEVWLSKDGQLVGSGPIVTAA